MFNLNKHKIIHIVLLSITLLYLTYFCYFGIKVAQYPFLGIKLIPNESHWMVESTMTTGIGEELGVKPGDVIELIDGDKQLNHYILKKWLILEQVSSFSVERSGEIIHFRVPISGKHNIISYFIMTFFSLHFLSLGIVTYYKKHYVHYSKYFLLFNLGMSFALLSAVPSAFGFLSSRIIFCLSLIWFSYYLVKFILFFPVSITEAKVARITSTVSFVMAIGFTVFVFCHLIFELPYILIAFLIKGIMLPVVFSLVAMPFLLALISLRKINIKERYQVKLLLFCSLLGYLPTIIFYMVPMIWNIEEVSFVSTTFFLFLIPVICSYILLKKGDLNFFMIVPNFIIRILYSIVVIITFLLLYSFQKKTGNTALVLLFSLFFFWGAQMTYSHIIGWNTARNYRRKENQQTIVGVLTKYKQNNYTREMLEFIINELSRMVDAKGSIIVLLNHFHTECIYSNELDDDITTGIKVNRQRKLSIQPELQNQISDQVPIICNRKVIGHLLIIGMKEKGKLDRMLLEKYVFQISNFLSYMKELEDIRIEYIKRLNKTDELSFSKEMNDDYYFIEKLEEEKEKISHYLHDSIIQSLIFVLRDLKELREDKNQNNKKRVNYMLENLENALFDLRNLCFDLYPSLVEDIGFKKAVDYLIREVQRSSDLIVTSEYETFVENELPLPLKLASFRMVKELVNNVLKHAKASKLALNFIMEGDVFIIEVEDDGEGIELTDLHKNLTKNRRFGLVSIKRKVNYLRGTFDIYRNRWSGTTFVITIPNSKKDGDVYERTN
ncbi:ATP-binding protein [Bacillus sp. JJ634]